MEAKPTIYIETSVISLLTARATQDVLAVARQHATRRWWEERRPDFDCFVSQLVLAEIGGGDAEAAGLRMQAAADLPLLDETDEMRSLAMRLIRAVGFPPRAASDALHVAIAVQNGIDYLLSWNLRHIVNPVFRDRVGVYCRSIGLNPPIICRPDDLLET